MFLRESIRHCPACDEVTPHNHRRIALPKIVAATAVITAAVCGWAGSVWVIFAIVLSVLALFVLQIDRERFWRVRCVRCRTKLIVQARRTKPTLDDHTIFYVA
jgi:hypothetical protein